MIKQVESKRILQPVASKQGDFWFGIDFNMNLYRGCSHGCIYCDSRSECYRVDDFDQVRVKKDCLSMLERELASKRKKGVVGIGAMSDSYNPHEKDLEVTRSALKLLFNHGFGVSLETKGSLIVRDVDVLARIAERSPCVVKLTITAAEDRISRLIEPGASPSSRRFEAVKALSEAGVYTGVLMMPLLPHITATEENVRSIVFLAAEKGASFVYPMMGVTLRDRQREHFFNMLDRDFPGLKERYMAEFKNNYLCQAQPQDRLWSVFCQECERCGLKWKMEDIIAGYKSGFGKHEKDSSEQMTFF